MGIHFLKEPLVYPLFYNIPYHLSVVGIKVGIHIPKGLLLTYLAPEVHQHLIRYTILGNLKADIQQTPEGLLWVFYTVKFVGDQGIPLVYQVLHSRDKELFFGIKVVMYNALTDLSLVRYILHSTGIIALFQDALVGSLDYLLFPLLGKGYFLYL